MPELHRKATTRDTRARFRALIPLLATLIAGFPTFTFAGEVSSMPTPKVIILDVNETLLDLAPLRTVVGQALQGRDDLLPLWFSTMLHYSLVETLTGTYHDFGEIGAAALIMVAEGQGIALDSTAARQAIGGTITRLPAHPDVIPALQAITASGFRVVSLTNSSNAGVTAQFAYAGLTEYVERRFSVEDLQAYKPDPRPYRLVLETLGLKPEEALMVAAHAWDLAGAKAVGLQTAFIRRAGTALYPNADRPDYVVENLLQLADILATDHPDAGGPGISPQLEAR